MELETVERQQWKSVMEEVINAKEINERYNFLSHKSLYGFDSVSVEEVSEENARFYAKLRAFYLKNKLRGASDLDLTSYIYCLPELETKKDSYNWGLIYPLGHVENKRPPVRIG